MWILQIRQLHKDRTYQPGEPLFSEGSLPLKHGKTYTVGRQDNVKATDVAANQRLDNDIVVKVKEVGKRAGRIIVDAWDRGVDKQSGVDCPKITFWNDPKSSTDNDRKKVTSWKPMNGFAGDSYDERDYAKADEKADFVVCHGMLVHLCDTVILRFLWQPVLVWDVNKTAERAEKYTYLNQFMIAKSLDYHPSHTLATVKGTIDPADRDCLVSLTNNVPIVTPGWLASLQDNLKKFADLKSPKEVFALPSCSAFLPPVKTGVDDARKKAEWWQPNPDRALIWKGKTVIMLGGKGSNSEEKYFRYLGANIKRLDILSRDKRIRNLDGLRARMQPDVEAADQHFQETLNAAKEDRQSRLPWTMEKGHVAVALSEGLLEDYLASDAKFFEDVLEPLDKSGIPVNFAENWWLSLTNNDWRDFSMSKAPSPETVPDSQPQSPASAGTSLEKESATVPAKPTAQQSVGVPSTHPEEKEPTLPTAVNRPLVLRARPGQRPRSLLESDSSDDDIPAARPPKRSRLANEIQPKPPSKTLAKDSATNAAQSLSETQKSNGSAGTALRLRAGRGRSGLLDDIDEDDSEDGSVGKSGTKNSLNAYRSLYNSVKQTAGGTSQGAQSDRPETLEEEEDFVQRSIIRQKKEAKETHETQGSAATNRDEDDDQDMEDTRSQQQPTLDSKAAATRQPLHTQHVEPTRPEAVTKDTEFLQAVTKARKGAKALDDFDQEFNALKIAKPKKNGATKVYGAGLFDPSRIYNSVLDLDTDVTGNFIKIERVNLFRKDKKQDRAVNQDWAGRPNFKKFKKQDVSRHPPVKLTLAPAADYGIGLEYWPDKKSNEGEMELPLHSQARATQSQAATQTARPASILARPKRNLLRVDSDDDSGVIALPTLSRNAAGALVTQARGGRATSTATKNNSAQASRTGSTTGRGTSKTPSTNLLAIESDEDEQPVRNRRRAAGNSLGDSSQADDVLGSGPSHSASATSSTNKRKRLVQMDDDDDDDDGMIFPGARRKRR